MTVDSSSQKIVTAFAPATVANLNSGFDVLGLALTEIGDRVSVSENKLNKNRIIAINNATDLPKEVDKNCCTVVIDAMQQDFYKNVPHKTVYVDVEIDKGIASGSGLGSSSASSAAAAVAYQGLISSSYSKDELIHFACSGELIASGSLHFDNIAPAILGGMVLCTESVTEPFMRLPLPAGLDLLIIFPQVKVNTMVARAALPAKVSLPIVTKQMAYLAATVRSLYEKDTRGFTENLVDLLAMPSRQFLIPYFKELESVFRKFKVLAHGISGSGPAMFAFIEQGRKTDNLFDEIKKLYKLHDIECHTHYFSLDKPIGAHLINKKAHEIL